MKDEIYHASITTKKKKDKIRKSWLFARLCSLPGMQDQLQPDSCAMPRHRSKGQFTQLPSDCSNAELRAEKRQVLLFKTFFP